MRIYAVFRTKFTPNVRYIVIGKPHSPAFKIIIRIVITNIFVRHIAIGFARFFVVRIAKIVRMRACNINNALQIHQRSCHPRIIARVVRKHEQHVVAHPFHFKSIVHFYTQIAIFIISLRISREAIYGVRLVKKSNLFDVIVFFLLNKILDTIRKAIDKKLFVFGVRIGNPLRVVWNTHKPSRTRIDTPHGNVDRNTILFRHIQNAVNRLHFRSIPLINPLFGIILVDNKPRRQQHHTDTL